MIAQSRISVETHGQCRDTQYVRYMHAAWGINRSVLHATPPSLGNDVENGPRRLAYWYTMCTHLEYVPRSACTPDQVLRASRLENYITIESLASYPYSTSKIPNFL